MRYSSYFCQDASKRQNIMAAVSRIDKLQCFTFGITSSCTKNKQMQFRKTFTCSICSSKVPEMLVWSLFTIFFEARVYINKFSMRYRNFFHQRPFINCLNITEPILKKLKI